MSDEELRNEFLSLASKTRTQSDQDRFDAIKFLIEDKDRKEQRRLEQQRLEEQRLQREFLIEQQRFEIEQRKHQREFEQKVEAELQKRFRESQPSRVDLKSLIYNHSCSSLTQALAEVLPFQIPISDSSLVQQFPDVFQHSISDIDLSIRHFLQHLKIGSNETTTNILDSGWLEILLQCVDGVDILQNENDSSSLKTLRPDSTVQVFGALALKGEAKTTIQNLPKAFDELTSKFNQDAYRVFPKNTSTIVGITSSIQRINLNLITYNHIETSSTYTYSASLYKNYEVHQLSGRVSFLVDVIKVCRWMATIKGSTQDFHLIPDVRIKTKNDHFITWKREGLFKEFDHKREWSQIFSYLGQVYSHNLVHVEHGQIIDDHSILITRLGNQLSSANLARFSLSTTQVISQVEMGLKELHDLGYAHCDLSLSNVFIDDSGVVFLDDLEYLTPVTDPPPHLTRLPFGVTPDHVTTALELDNHQLQTFKNQIRHL